MKHERVLLILILSEVALVGFGILTRFVLLGDSGAARSPNTLLTALWISIVVATVVSWIGLLNLVRGARPLYLASWAGYFVFIILSEPMASTAIDTVTQLLAALTSGSIIGLVYFSELRARFRTLAEAVREVRQGAS
jgi:hypothetical protein